MPDNYTRFNTRSKECIKCSNKDKCNLEAIFNEIPCPCIKCFLAFICKKQCEKILTFLDYQVKEWMDSKRI